MLLQSLANDKWIPVRCPACSSKKNGQGKEINGMLFKIKGCLSGTAFIEIKCRMCKQIVRVP